MSDQVCYPTSQVPFYVLFIVLISFIFFMIFWQSNKNYHDYHISYQMTDNNIYKKEQPPTVTIGSHFSSHSSAVASAPFRKPY